MHKQRFVAFLASFAGLTEAFWRLPCRGRAGVARMDPLVDPGMPSYHVHSVQGSGGFAMDVTEDGLRQSDCTSCAVTQDKSAYWAPALYFVHANGSAELVEQDGGMLVYYLLYGENVTAFPNNFRMLAGDTFLRDFPWPVPDPPKSSWAGVQTSQDALRQRAIGFNCLNYNEAAEPSLYRHYLPSKAYMDEHCTDGVRFELMFPSCWNGKDVDSPDHKSHMAYPSAVMSGDCPAGFETRLVSLFFETIWNTPAFKDEEGEFVIANGDPTGYGYHGDFIQGWDPDFLQQAVDTCTNPSGEVTDCHIFDIQSDAEQGKCKFQVPEQLQSEDVYMHLNGLPGDIAIQSGPAYASPVAYATPSQATSIVPSIVAPSPSSQGTSILTPPASPTSSAQSTPVVLAQQLTSSTTTSQATATATVTTKYIQSVVAEEIVYVQQEIIITIDGEGKPIGTGTGSVRTVATTSTTVTEPVDGVTGLAQPGKRGHGHERGHSHGHRHAHFHRRHA